MEKDFFENVENNEHEEVFVCANCGEIIEDLKNGCNNCNLACGSY